VRQLVFPRLLAREIGKDGGGFVRRGSLVIGRSQGMGCRQEPFRLLGGKSLEFSSQAGLELVLEVGGPGRVGLYDVTLASTH
jgi:hypothetical protein